MAYINNIKNTTRISIIINLHTQIPKKKKTKRKHGKREITINQNNLYIYPSTKII